MELWSPAPKTSVKKRMPIQRSCYSCGQPGHLAKDYSSFSSSGKKESTSTSSKGEDVGKVEKKLKKDEKPLVCYNCGGRAWAYFKAVPEGVTLLWDKEVW